MPGDIFSLGQHVAEDVAKSSVNAKGKLEKEQAMNQVPDLSLIVRAKVATFWRETKPRPLNLVCLLTKFNQDLQKC
jgi:hypothetical protein